MPNLIKDFRLRRGLTQEQLAERVETSLQQISRLENDKRRVSLSWLERLGSALNVRPAALIDREIALFAEAESIGEVVDQSAKLRLLGLISRMPPEMLQAFVVVATGNATQVIQIAAARTRTKIGKPDDDAPIHDDVPTIAHDAPIVQKTMTRAKKRPS